MGEPRNSLVVYSLDPLDQTGVIPHSRLFNMGQCDSFCSDMFTYSGQMLLLGPEFRVAHQFSIRSMHVYKHGWCWVFDPVVLVPTPFLMTDQTSMRVLYTGRVLFEPNDQLRGVLAQHSTFRSFPVSGTGWRGVVTLPLGKLSPKAAAAQLFAFTDMSIVELTGVHDVTVPTNIQLGGTLIVE